MADILPILSEDTIKGILNDIDFDHIELDKATLVGIFNKLDVSKNILSTLLCENNVETMAQILELDGFVITNHDIITEATSQEMVNLLLCEDSPDTSRERKVDLNKITKTNSFTNRRIIKCIATSTLRYPINPNVLFDGTPFWRALLSNTGLIEDQKMVNLKLMRYTGPNFTEPLNIDAVDINGNTYLHTCIEVVEEILTLNPNPNILNKAGQTPLERQKMYSRNAAVLERYVTTKGKELDIKLSEALRAKEEECAILQKKLDSISSLLKR